MHRNSTGETSRATTSVGQRKTELSSTLSTPPQQRGGPLLWPERRTSKFPHVRQPQERTRFLQEPGAGKALAVVLSRSRQQTPQVRRGSGGQAPGAPRAAPPGARFAPAGRSWGWKEWAGSHPSPSWSRRGSCTAYATCVPMTTDRQLSLTRSQVHTRPQCFLLAGPTLTKTDYN